MENISEKKIIDIDGNSFDKEDLINLLRLQKQLLIEENLFVSIEEAANIWGGYSNDLSASWLYMPKKDENILKEIKSSNFFTTFEQYAK